MAHERVHCIRKLNVPADHIWAVVRDFDVGWHPDVTHCKLQRTVSGALLREFETTDGRHLSERRTYISDTDRVMCYTVQSGIDGLASYHARLTVTPEAETSATVTWSAEISARAERCTEIAAGTKEVFEAGLDALTLAEPAKPDPWAKGTPLAETRSGAVEGTPRLSYLTGGTDADRPRTLVLFLHGIGGQAANWTSQIQHLGSKFCVAAMNFRGYGDSTLGFAQTQMDDHCDDIMAMAEHFSAERLVLVSMSMGSWIATSFAMRHADKLAGLVLAGGCTGMSEASADERENFRVSRDVPLSQGQSPADFAPAVVNVIAGPNASDEARNEMHCSMAAIPTETYRDALNCFCNPLEKFDFSKVTCPVLLVTGEYDRLAPVDEIRRVSERIHDAGVVKRGWSDVRFEIIGDAGHLCNLEQPEHFNHLLHRFLQRLPGAAKNGKLSRAEKQQQKRLRILNAARREFCSVGFDGASMDRLAEAAAVSKPTLYDYFGDKEGLFAAVLDEGRAHITAPLTARDGSLVDRLWDFSWTYAEFVLRPDMLSLARLVLGEAARRPETAIKYHASGPGRAFEGLVSFIETAVDAREITVDDPRYAANDLWSLILSGPRDYYLHHVTERPQETEMLKAIAHGLAVFLKAYSANLETDRSTLELKVEEKRKELEAAR